MPSKVGNSALIPLPASQNPPWNKYFTSLAIFFWNLLFLESNNSHFYPPRQFSLKCRDSHGETFCPSIFEKKKNCRGKL